MKKITLLFARPAITLFIVAVSILIIQTNQPAKRPIHALVGATAHSRSTKPLAQAPSDAASSTAAAPVVPDYHLSPQSNGLPQVYDYIPTKEKVVFLTIDDGATQTPDAPLLLGLYHMKVPLFLNDIYVAPHTDYFQSLLSLGEVVEDHTIDHADLLPLSLAQQQNEICGDADELSSQLGTARPTLFRPPNGDFNDTTLQAAANCGMKAIIMWHAKANGGSMQYQDGNTGLLPGDIVLMHFRPEFTADFAAFKAAADAAGLQPELLTDWLQPPPAD